MSDIVVKDTAELIFALSHARSGDNIKLSQGIYSGFSIRNVKIAGNVNITSLDSANKATIDGLSITNSGGMNFNGLNFIATGVRNSQAFRIGGSNNISFSNDVFHGALGGNPSNDADGFGVGGSSNISITNSEFEELGRAVIIGSSTNINISGNLFHAIRSDGMDFSQVSNVKITNNSLTDFYPIAGDHPDAIQFSETRFNTVQSHNIVISGNTIARGLGRPMQGIFLKDSSGHLPYYNITISNNHLVGTGYNGIYVKGAHDVIIDGNNLQSYLLNHDKTWIKAQNIVNLSTTNNVSKVFLNINVTHPTSSGNSIGAAIADPAGYVVTSNTNANLLGTLYHNLTLTGTASANAIGNNLGNHLTGNAGDNHLIGGDGNDYLDGGAGNDTLTGGAGNNIFLFQTSSGHDVITDFLYPGDHNMLNIEAYLHAGVRPTLTDVGANVMIGLGAGHDITLLGVHASDLIPTAYGYTH